MSHCEKLFIEAQQYIPGGVNSPVRAFRAVGGTPPYFKQGHGAYLIDEDNRRYIDYVCSWGPLILGHAYPTVVEAVQTTAAKGLSFGAPCALEIALASQICHLMPNIEKVRMVNSGTEAAMSAIRLARAATGRNKIIKFEGCYHGHVDSLLVKAGSGALTFGTPSSPGVPNSIVEHTLIATFNDIDSVQALFEQHGNDIAAIVIEPIAANMNLVMPLPGFLSTLRQLCDQYKSLLIFDEVITGFRVALGGAQQYFNIKPDLTILGKIIGGGMPVGAFGGRTDIMEQLAPIGPVYQAGTLSGNPVAMAAGLATLKALTTPNFYQKLEATSQQLMTGLSTLATSLKIPFKAKHIGSLFGLFFTEAADIESYQQVLQCNQAHFRSFFHAMLRQGVYLAPSAYEAGFVSAAHGIDEINATLKAAEQAFVEIKK